MINLLPDEKKKELRKRYRMRLLTVSLLSASVAMIVLGVMLVPSYFAFSIKANGLKASLDEIPKDDRLNVEEEITALSEFSKSIKDIFPSTKDRNLITGRVLTVIENKPRGIHITDISANSNGEFYMRGSADRREDMISFTEYLEALDDISNVNSPISNLISETDGFFVVDFTYKK